MAKRPILTDVTSLTNSSAITSLNQNWDAIEEAFDNTLSLDGSTPNAMTADLDLNGNALLNVGTIDVENLTLDGQQVTDLATVPEWRGPWLTATSYVKNDLVNNSGSSYICLVPHTSGTFSTDLTALRWELFAQKGAAGAGTGDMIGSNNLSDVTNAATARSNLGLGTAAVENTVPISKGGTNATDAVTARTNLGLGTLSTLSSVTTTQIDAGTLVTEAEGITANDNDTSLPTSAAVKDYVDTAVAGVPSGSVTLLGTITTSSGSSQSLSSLNLTSYKFLRLTFVNVSSSSSGNLRLDNENIYLSLGTTGLRGIADVDLTDGTFISSVAVAGLTDSAVATVYAGDVTLTTASTTVTVSLSSSSFAGGTVRVYGIL